jgi:hypothetical protein
MTKNSKHPQKSQGMYHSNHKPAVTRRDLIARGFASGFGYVFTPSILSFAAKDAFGACAESVAANATNFLPFMAVELAGGANLAGSNFMVGGRGGQLNYLAAGSYGSLGLPPDQEPTQSSIVMDSSMGIAMHPNSGFLFGLMSVTSAATRASVDAFVTASRSDDDTQNNPHSCLYWIQKAGSKGQLIDIIGTENTDSGARAAIPPESFNPSARPTVVSNFRGAAGLISAGAIEERLAGQAGKILAASRAMSEQRLAAFNTKTLPDQVKELVRCGYLKSEENVAKVSSNALNPETDAEVVALRAITTVVDFPVVAGSRPIARNFQNFNAGNDERVISIAKLVLDGYAGSGSVVLGGYDYHGNPRATQELKDFEAGRSVGLALELAHLKQKNLALYVYTDGSVSCGNAGQVENTPGAGNKPAFTSDNGARSSAVMFVHRAGNAGRPELVEAQRRQLGFHDVGGAVGDDGSFVTSNNPVLVSKLMVLNYLALLGKEADLAKIVGDNPFEKDLAKYLMFKKLG